MNKMYTDYLVCWDVAEVFTLLFPMFKKIYVYNISISSGPS